MKTILLIVLTFGVWSTLHSQNLEKTHEISNKSKRGNIADLRYDEVTGAIEISYLYNTSVNGEGQYETYRYDNLFNPIDNTVKKGPLKDLNADKEESNYRGDSYSVNGVRMGYNFSLKMELAIIKTETRFTYNWDINDYTSEVFEKDRTTLSPKDAPGYIGFAGVEDVYNGGGLFITALRGKTFSMGEDQYMQYKHYRFIKLNDDLSIANETKLDLEQMHDIVYQKPIYQQTNITAMPKLLGIAVVLAPVYKKKANNKPAEEWKALFIDTDGNISKHVDVKVPSTKWDISDIIYDEQKNEMYLYGPANKSVNKKGVVKYYKNLNVQSSSSMSIGGEKKYSMFQIMKIKDGELSYITNESLEAMEGKTYTLKGKSKKRVYKARKFEVMGVNTMDNGDFMIFGTNYSTKDSLGNKFNYKEAVTIHFDKNGGVNKIYAIKPNEKNYQTVPMTNTVVKDKSGKYLYWILEENKGTKSTLTTVGTATKTNTSYSYSGSFVWKYKYLLYPRVIKIDLDNATMREYIPGNKEYFLDNKYPFVQDKEGNFIFFGSDKKGKNIWFNRLDLN